MGVIKGKIKKRYFKESFSLMIPLMVRPAHHERDQHHWTHRITVRPDPVEGLNHKILKKQECASLYALTAAALILPGLFQSSAQAADEDSVDFQYSHYQEGKRDGFSLLKPNPTTGIVSKRAVIDNRNPIEVDSLHGSAKITLTDRVKFAFNYTEDTWSGATPFGSAPEESDANRGGGNILPDGSIIAGASPYASTNIYLDSKDNPVYRFVDPVTGQSSFLKDRPVHVMSYASPETRQQGDFKLGYEWDEAALEVGGGISIERDYESRFVNLGGRMDFNQKQTTVNLGLSYTNSAINAALNQDGVGWFQWSEQHDSLINYDIPTDQSTLRGNREDWATHLSLTQVVNTDAVMELGMGYTRSTGFLENPYKISWLFSVDPDKKPIELPDGTVYSRAKGTPFIEQRPDERNQWNWTARWAQYIEPMDAALHLDYQFAHDDWGINAHTFAADWVQPLGDGWAVAPRVRYYSQETADFYQPYFIVDRSADAVKGKNIYGFILPDNFSSDQRLSGYGTLSGGVTVSKQFTKGVSLETGFEYYTHQGNLKLGGGGEQGFADFDYWVANAALKINLSSLGQSGSGGSYDHINHDDHPSIPAGLLFGHTLDKAGDMMVGYRYMRTMQGGDILHGTQPVSELKAIAKGCPGTPRLNSDDQVVGFDGGCKMLPQEMTMNMHMLELMAAPTDWLTLMLMPQFMDMDMGLYTPSSLRLSPEELAHRHSHAGHGHETGGIGDTGMYALVKLFDTKQHHLHTSLGVTAPTGDVGIKLKEGTKNTDAAYIHYGMQLGSGTWDFKPSLTYTGKVEDWSWGAQVGGTKRMESSNSSGFAVGDLFETSIWGGYDLTHWLSASVRAAYTWQGSIEGRYPRSTRRDVGFEGACAKVDFIYEDNDPETGEPITPPYFHQAVYSACLAGIEEGKLVNDATDRPTPMDFPSNYGGHYVDIGFGLSATVPSGSLAGNKLSFEWLQPVYTDVNGYQLDRDGALSFTWAYGF
ncbi:MAG: DUF3570 domain-containing protein [Methyloglobulus sp.]|nr:DUF3570 domain-containing protein [Methyloglobulus sp.]